MRWRKIAAHAATLERINTQTEKHSSQALATMLQLMLQYLNLSTNKQKKQLFTCSCTNLSANRKKRPAHAPTKPQRAQSYQPAEKSCGTIPKQHLLIAMWLLHVPCHGLCLATAPALQLPMHSLCLCRGTASALPLPPPCPICLLNRTLHMLWQQSCSSCYHP